MKIFRHFEENKTDQKFNLPNALSLIRGVGGVALGAMMATNEISASKAILFGFILGMTDAEGQVITLSDRFPRIKKALGIYPSKLGKILDPVMDKALVGAMVTGGLIGGDISPVVGSGIIATELATSGVTISAQLKGNEPSVSNIGKMSMLARGVAIGADLASHAITPEQSQIAHNIMSDVTAVGFVGAIALSGLSCYKMAKDYVFQPKNN